MKYMIYFPWVVFLFGTVWLIVHGAKAKREYLHRSIVKKLRDKTNVRESTLNELIEILGAYPSELDELLDLSPSEVEALRERLSKLRKLRERHSKPEI